MRKNIYGVVYKITNRMNNKIYIGITTSNRGFDGRYSAKGKNIERVYNFYSYQKKNNQFVNVHLYNSIKKYGFEAFEVNKQFDIAYSKKELYEKEKKWIAYYKANNLNKGYNRTEGGDSFLSGSDHPRYNKIKFKCETCGKECEDCVSHYYRHKNHYCSQKCSLLGYSKIYVKENNPNYNRIKLKCDYCGKSIIRPKSLINSKNYCSKKCQYEHQKIIMANKNNPRARAVICTTTGKIFNTSKEGAEYYKCTRQHISKCCNGKNIYCGKLSDGTKLKWMYYKNYIEQNKKCLIS